MNTNNWDENRIQRADLLPTKTYFIIGFDKFLTEDEYQFAMDFLAPEGIVPGVTNWVEDIFYNNPKSIKHGNIEDTGEVPEA